VSLRAPLRSFSKGPSLLLVLNGSSRELVSDGPSLPPSPRFAFRAEHALGATGTMLWLPKPPVDLGELRGKTLAQIMADYVVFISPGYGGGWGTSWEISLCP
jgi:hypothetical protein